MATISELKEQYDNLDYRVQIRDYTAIDPDCLLAFENDFPEQETLVHLDTDEFTAVCPWTGQPDYGTLDISYVPAQSCIELKSLKYYLLSYRSVGIVQENAANRILNDLVDLCHPRRMKVTLDYRVRGGIHTVVTVKYPTTSAPPVVGE